MKKAIIYSIAILIILGGFLATIKPVRAFVEETVEELFNRVMGRAIEDHINDAKYNWAEPMNILTNRDPESNEYKEAQKQVEANFKDINIEIEKELDSALIQ